MKRILIVGGVAGGATAAARFRRQDEEAEIIVFERGEAVTDKRADLFAAAIHAQMTADDLGRHRFIACATACALILR